MTLGDTMRMKTLMTAVACVTALLTLSAQTAPAGERGVGVRRWDVPAISSPMWESHPAIDPVTRDLWFVRSDAKFSGWRILVSRCVHGGWAAPEPMPFAEAGLEADPHFTPDGRSLYFIASHGSGSLRSEALDIWRVDRDRTGHWLRPERLPAPVNSDAAEWFPRPARDGWLYFGSHREGGFGQDDIWRARRTPGGKWQVENAGREINGAGDEYEFQPSPDGRWALLSADSGLYRLERTAHGWGHKRALGPEINGTRTEIGPMILADGRSFLFSRDAGDGRSGELYLSGDAKAAPSCRR
jgi:hypothetical protein